MLVGSMPPTNASRSSTTTIFSWQAPTRRSVASSTARTRLPFRSARSAAIASQRDGRRMGSDAPAHSSRRTSTRSVASASTSRSWPGSSPRSRANSGSPPRTPGARESAHHERRRRCRRRTASSTAAPSDRSRRCTAPGLAILRLDVGTDRTTRTRRRQPQRGRHRGPSPGFALNSGAQRRSSTTSAPHPSSARWATRRAAPGPRRRRCTHAAFDLPRQTAQACQAHPVGTGSGAGRVGA
jgi:hypothetical protein